MSNDRNNNNTSGRHRSADSHVTPRPRRAALGRGLDALIMPDDIQTGGSSAISEIEISRIDPNPDQPRRTFDTESLEELAGSIRELGIVQPLTLRMTPSGRYQIIAGERRWRAAGMAGISSVPAYIRTASDLQMTEMALIENIQRQDLNAIEVALGFKKLIDTYSLTQERLSERLGKNRATIANHLRLLRLPAEIQLALRDHIIDMGHARALLALDDTKAQLRIYRQTVKDGLSVRAVEALVKKETMKDASKPQNEKKATEEINPEYGRIADSLTKILESPVKFARKQDGKGSITISFKNDDELHRLISIFDSLSTK